MNGPAAALGLALCAASGGGATFDDDACAALFFGPPGQPFYDAARAIMAGAPPSALELAGVAPLVDRRLEPDAARETAEPGLTLLQLAWERHDVPALTELLDLGADWRRPLLTPDFVGLEPPSLLDEALASRAPEAAPVIAVLLARGLDPDARSDDDEREPLLMRALATPNPPVWRALVEDGADPWLRSMGIDARDAVGMAIDQGEPDLVAWLAERGAFAARTPQQVYETLRRIAERPRAVPAEWQGNQRAARAVIRRTGYPADTTVRWLFPRGIDHDSP